MEEECHIVNRSLDQLKFQGTSPKKSLDSGLITSTFHVFLLSDVSSRVGGWEENV